MRHLGDLNIALIQTHLTWQNAEANRAHFDQLFTKAEGADLIILPEMFTTGFSMDSKNLAELENGKSVQWLRQSAVHLKAAIAGSMIICTEQKQYFNRLFWARPDGTITHYDKRHLFRMSNEHKHFSAGERQLIVEYKGWKIRPLICYDLRFPVWSRDAYDTDLLLYVACWPSPRCKQWNRLLAARAIENLCYVAAVNCLGTDGNNQVYSGDSQIVDYLGDQLLDAQDKEGVFHYKLLGKNLNLHRETFPAYQDADLFELK